MCPSLTRAANLARVYRRMSQCLGVEHPAAMVVVDSASSQVRGVGRLSSCTPDVDSMLAEALMYLWRMRAGPVSSAATIRRSDWSVAPLGDCESRVGLNLAVGCCITELKPGECILTDGIKKRGKLAINVLRTSHDDSLCSSSLQQRTNQKRDGAHVAETHDDSLLLLYAGTECADGHPTMFTKNGQYSLSLKYTPPQHGKRPKETTGERGQPAVRVRAGSCAEIDSDELSSIAPCTSWEASGRMAEASLVDSVVSIEYTDTSDISHTLNERLGAAAVKTVVQVLVVSKDQERVLLHTHISGPFRGRMTGCLEEVDLRPFCPRTHTAPPAKARSSAYGRSNVTSGLVGVKHRQIIEHAHHILQQELRVDRGVLTSSVVHSTCAGVFEFLELADGEAIPPVIEYETVVVVDDTKQPWRDFLHVSTPTQCYQSTGASDKYKVAETESIPQTCDVLSANRTSLHPKAPTDTIAGDQPVYSQRDQSYSGGSVLYPSAVNFAGEASTASDSFTWHKRTSIPYDCMPQDDRHWYELVLNRAQRNTQAVQRDAVSETRREDVHASKGHKNVTNVDQWEVESGVFVFDGTELQCWHIRAP